MIDSFVLLTPLLMLGVIALVRFVGCNQVFGIDPTVQTAPPPTNLKAVAGDQRVDLTWDYEHGDATKFEIWYHDNTGSLYVLYPSPEIHIETTQGQVQHGRTSIPNLTNGTTYFFKVTAYTAQSSSSLNDSVEVFATPGVTAFVTLVMAGSPRNNFSGWVGMAVQMYGDALVTQLGRLVVANNTRPHALRIVDPAQGNTVLGTVTVNMPAGPIGEFAYQPLPQAVALQAFRIYYFLTHEDNLGDLFHDILGTSVTTTAIGSILSGVYSDDVAPDTYMLVGSNNQTYGPVNFTY